MFDNWIKLTRVTQNKMGFLWSLTVPIFHNYSHSPLLLWHTLTDFWLWSDKPLLTVTECDLCPSRWSCELSQNCGGKRRAENAHRVVKIHSLLCRPSWPKLKQVLTLTNTQPMKHGGYNLGKRHTSHTKGKNWEILLLPRRLRGAQMTVPSVTPPEISI